MRNRTLKALAGALVAAALVVAPLVTAGASATEQPLKGEIGKIEDQTPKGNDTPYWEKRFAEFDVQCFKHAGTGSNEHGAVTDNRKTVTLNEFQDGWHGDGWVVLVINAGTSNNVIVNPKAGVAYASPTNNGGNQADVSHWIVCKGTTPPVTQPVVVKPALSWTPPTCIAAGLLTRGDNVEWSSKLNDDGTTTWTASPKPGTTFAGDAQLSWVVPDLGIRKDCEVPGPLVETGEWQDGIWTCGATTVTQTREVSTTTYTRDDQGTVVPSTTKSTETQTRPLTQSEIGENCDLVPGDIDSVCVGDVPYLGYELTLPAGFTAPSQTPVTITFINPEGDDYVVHSQPLTGKLLWPGASATAPKMWPGWELVNGEYVQTDGNFAWTRAGVTVRFEVNPGYSTEVEYPQASAECANPPIGGPDGSEEPVPTTDTPAGDTPTTGTPAASTDAKALAVTGGGVSPMIVAAGGAALLAGIAVVAVAAYRRRNASID